jgi:hypothetical protein
MALIIPPGYAQAVLKWQLTGDPELMVSTIGYDVSGAGGDFNAFADGLAATYYAAFGAAGRLSVYTFKGVTLYVGQDGTPPTVYESIVTGAAGTNAGNPPPSNCAMLMRKLTALGGRRGRGRSYLPPFALAETDVTATGAITEAVRSGIESNLTGWLVTSREPVLLHSDGGLTPAPAPTPITSIKLDSIIATQRQRMRR